MTITETTPVTRIVDGTEVPAPGRYELDPSHSHVGFSVRHLMVSKTKGRFADVLATIVIDDDPLASSVDVEIPVASVDTRDETRDGHLRSADFFDAETHPEITFVSTAVTPTRGTDYTVTGDLTIRGTTRPATFDVEFLGLYDGFQGRRAGFHATTTINREDWGLTWNVTLETGGWLVGKEIKLEIDLALDEVVGPATTIGTPEGEPVTA